MSVALLIQVFLLLAKEAPLAIDTFNKIKNALASDPSTPEDLAAILKKTGDNNAAAISEGLAWLAAHSA